MIVPSNHEAQIESRPNVTDRDTSINNTNDPNQGNGPQVDMHTIEEKTLLVKCGGS